MTEPYHCPKCKKDLRKVGILLTDTFTKNTFRYIFRCVNCRTKLDLELREVRDTLPKNIKELKNA